jgi:hypothetical protein
MSLDGLGDQLGYPAAWHERCRSLDALKLRPKVQLGTDAAAVRQVLPGDPAWASLLLETQGERASLATRYLSESGVFGSEAVGIVDLGWVGRVGAALDGAARSGGYHPLTHFFFGLAEEATGVCPADSYVFYADHRQTEDRIRPLYCTPLEVLCSSSEPRYVGFEIRDGKVVPKLAPDDQTLSDQRRTYSGRVEYGVGLAVDQYLETQGPVSFPTRDLQDPSILMALCKNLASFWDNPTFQEAAAWSGYMHTRGIDDSLSPLARPLGIRDLVLRSRWYDLLWPAGSLRLSTNYIRAGAHLIELARSARITRNR